MPSTNTLWQNCFSRALKSCRHTPDCCSMHRVLQRSMLSTLFSAHKLSSTIPETEKNMRDMPMRQTLCSPVPQGRDAWIWVLISAVVGTEGGCKIWVWICLSPSLLPMPPKTPFLLSLGALTPAKLQEPSEWIPMDESELFGSQIPPTVQLYLRTSAHLFS